jgi:hypothetical protein
MQTRNNPYDHILVMAIKNEIGEVHLTSFSTASYKGFEL